MSQTTMSHGAARRRTTRLVPTALAAVLMLGACGADGGDAVPRPEPDASGLRAPEPIEIASGSGSGALGRPSAESSAASDMMIAPFFDIEYVLGDGLDLPTDDTGYVYAAAGVPSDEAVASLADAFGLEGEPLRTDDGYTAYVRIGPDDGSAPSLYVYADGQQSWNYSAAWALEEVRVACAVAIDPAPDDSSAPSGSVEPIEIVEDDCPQPEPPAGVPTAAEAEQRVTDLLTAIGVDPASVEFDTWADEWSANVSVSDTTDARAQLRYWNFGFGGEGRLQYASGSLATPQPVGPYPLVDLETAFTRLREGGAGGWFGPAVGMPAIAEAAPAVDPEVDVMESGEPAAEPMPVDEQVPGGEPMEPETVTVTLTSVEADLWWVWDVNGTAWLLPAYRFVGDDGGWYTVPAVTDEYLVVVDTPDRGIPEPMPVEPDDGGTDGAVEPQPGATEPGAPPVVAPEELASMIGQPFEEFVMAAESLGYEVRVVERDGESFPVTDDYRLDRVNVVIVTVDGVEQVVAATTDDGTSLGSVTIEPTEPPATTASGAGEPVPIVGIYEDVVFYPACGNETLQHEGLTWYQVQEFDFPDEYAAAVEPDRDPADVFATPRGFAKVAPPGPGDDVGTLVVWADGVARFVSDSGDLDRWLIDDELVYDWVC